MFLVAFVALLAITTGIVLAVGAGSPTVGRQQAIATALHSRGVTESERLSRRVEAKLIHRFDFQRVEGSMAGPGNPFDRIWVVAVSGDFGVPSTMLPTKIAWGIAVVPDRLPAAVEAYVDGSDGNWPTFWDNLPDLAGGK